MAGSRIDRWGENRQGDHQHCGFFLSGRKQSSLKHSLASPEAQDRPALLSLRCTPSALSAANAAKPTPNTSIPTADNLAVLTYLDLGSYKTSA